jgi:hypothetical protein
MVGVTGSIPVAPTTESETYRTAPSGPNTQGTRRWRNDPQKQGVMDYARNLRLHLAGMARLVTSLLLLASGASRADSVFDLTDDSETFFQPFTLEAVATCDGLYTDGYVWAVGYPRRHFQFYALTPSGLVFVVDDVLFKSSMGSDCGPSGQVLED